MGGDVFTQDNLPPGQDPGRYPPDAKDCAMNAPPKWSVNSRKPYIVGAPNPARTSNVPVRDLRHFHEKGGALEPPAYTLKFRIDYTTQAQKKFPAPNHYDQSKHLNVDGAKRSAPKFGFGTARRFPRPRFPEARGEKK